LVERHGKPALDFWRDGELKSQSSRGFSSGQPRFRVGPSARLL
jgi:hypothetical protein